MDKLLNIIKNQIDYFEDEIERYINSGNSVIDFCKMPFEIKHLSVNKKEKQELEKIIKRIEKIQAELSNVLKE